MPRIRTIKPEMYHDEKLVVRPVIDRFVFMALISMADDAGRVLDNMKVIDAFMFAATDETARDSLVVLAGLGLIRRGETASGQRVIQIVNWKHQKIDKPNLSSALPPIQIADASPTPRRSVAEPSSSFQGDTQHVVVEDDAAFDETSSINRRNVVEASTPRIYDLRSTTDDLRSNNTHTARERFLEWVRVRSGSGGKHSTGWAEQLDAWKEGLGLQAGMRATDDDIEIALSDFLANGIGSPDRAFIRAHVVRIIKERKQAEPLPVNGTRRAGSMSMREMALAGAEALKGIHDQS